MKPDFIFIDYPAPCLHGNNPNLCTKCLPKDQRTGKLYEETKRKFLDNLKNDSKRKT